MEFHVKLQNKKDLEKIKERSKNGLFKTITGCQIDVEKDFVSHYDVFAEREDIIINCTPEAVKFEEALLHSNHISTYSKHYWIEFVGKVDKDIKVEGRYDLDLLPNNIDKLRENILTFIGILEKSNKIVNVQSL